jgi:hypothetical protein
MSPLLHELTAAARLAGRPELAGALAGLGLTGRALPLWGFAAVEPGREFYQPIPDGPPSSGKFALITAAFEDGLLVDLVATSLATRAMCRRLGEAALLGGERIGQAREAGRPLLVFADAWSWLCAGCLGIVILDFSRVGLLLSDLSAIGCQTPELASRVKRACERPMPVPFLFVPATKESADAS